MSNLTKRERERVEEARSSLYEVGQLRLWCKYPKILGPVRLLKREWDDIDPQGDVWLVELITTGMEHWIVVNEIGAQINEMEVLAWAAQGA